VRRSYNGKTFYGAGDNKGEDNINSVTDYHSSGRFFMGESF